MPKLRHSRHSRQRMRERSIPPEWIAAVIATPPVRYGHQGIFALSAKQLRQRFWETERGVRVVADMPRARIITVHWIS